MTQITMNDLLSPEARRNPAALYTRLREQDPLVYLPDFGGMGGAWVATTYDDVIAILKDSRFSRDKQKSLSAGKGQHDGPRAFAWKRDMLSVDPPDHTRLRRLVSKAFTPRMIEQLRPRIQQIADELLDAVQDQGQMDLIQDFAYPLPLTVICEMLGIPAADRPHFRAWTQALLNVTENPEQETAVLDAMDAFIAYIKKLLAEKHAHPGDDLLSDLVRVEEHGDVLNEQELMSTTFLLIVVGHETTVNLIGNGTLALLEHPEQLHLLQQDLSLIPSAVEELLRSAGPASMTIRWASEDIPMHGKVIRKGEMVYAALIAANTDPQKFPDPGVLDITREAHEHLAFGKGIHYCLGALLARLEGQIAFSTLLRRLPHLRLASAPEQLVWNRNPMLRGLRSLPVAF